MTEYVGPSKEALEAVRVLTDAFERIGQIQDKKLRRAACQMIWNLGQPPVRYELESPVAKFQKRAP